MLLNPYFGQYGGQFVPELLLPALDHSSAPTSTRRTIPPSGRSSTAC